MFLFRTNFGEHAAKPGNEMMSSHVRESGLRSPGKFCLWNPESWVLDSGIQLKESGIPLKIGIQNSSSRDKYWNPVPEIRKTVLDSLTWVNGDFHGEENGKFLCRTMGKN